MKQRGPRDELLPESHSTIPVSVEAGPPRSVARHPLSIRSARGRRRLGLAGGISVAAAAVTFLLLPEQAHLSAPGTMNAGHERLECAGCHQPAPGTIRQQLQADARYVLGKRASPADFGARDVDNDDCLACHERPFDRHPAFRFTEPRFAEVRASLAPHRCESCHREHSGARVTVQPGYCARCHEQLDMKKDPLDVPHVELVRQGRWLTCLGCHDFHGNHSMDKRTNVGSAIDARQIQRYFEGGPSPYPSLLRKPASQARVPHDD